MNDPVPTSHPASRTSSLAIVSLVFGLLGWSFLPGIGAIVAVVCGHLARGEIRRAPSAARIDGDGLAVAGLVLGYAQIAFCVLAMLALITLLMLGVAFSAWH